MCLTTSSRVSQSERFGWTPGSRDGVSGSRDETFDKLYVSPLTRATQTAEIIRERQGILGRYPVEVLPEVREPQLAACPVARSLSSTTPSLRAPLRTPALAAAASGYT